MCVAANITPAVLHELSWEFLTRSRKRARLCMIYKAVHGLVDMVGLEIRIFFLKPVIFSPAHKQFYLPIILSLRL